MRDTDIVDRLRTSRHKVPEHVIEPERREAADEIERLRKIETAYNAVINDHSETVGSLD